MLEALGVGDRVDEDNPMGALVEGLGDISEPFLACCVPDVESGGNSVDFDPFDFKIHPDGAEILMLKCVFAIPYKQACFSYSAVSHNQIFYCAVPGHRFLQFEDD